MASATFDLVLLSSSPPGSSGGTPNPFPHPPPPSNQRVNTRAYSPTVLALPNNSHSKAPSTLKSGSRAAPIPEGSTRGFATAGELVRSRHFAIEPDDDVAAVQTAQLQRSPTNDTITTEAVTEKLKKRATKAYAIGDSVEPKPNSKARKPKADKDNDVCVAADTHLKAPTTSSHFQKSAVINAIEPVGQPLIPAAKMRSAKPRKPRTRKTASTVCEAQLVTESTSVANPSTTVKATRKTRRSTKLDVAASGVGSEIGEPVLADRLEENGNVNMHESELDLESIWTVPRSPRRLRSPSERRPPDTKTQASDLDLDGAVARRQDWTPPKDTGSGQDFTALAGKENNATTKFTNMISNFTFVDAAASLSTTMARTKPTNSGRSSTKRRRVELVAVPGSETGHCAKSPEKGKAPKKKARTITDLVTGHYAAMNPDHEPSIDPHDFVAPGTSITKVPLHDSASINSAKTLARPPRKCSASKDISGKTTFKSKPKSKRASTKNSAKTKLVVDKLLSPTSAVSRLNKQDILFGTSSQLALDESPTLVRETQRAMHESEKDAEIKTIMVTPPPLWTRLGRVEGKRNLWHASSRDGDGLLLGKQNVYTPEPDRTQDLHLLMDGAQDEAGRSFVDMDDTRPAPILISSDMPTPPHSIPCHIIRDTQQIYADCSSFDDIDDYQAPPPSNQMAFSSFLDIDDIPPSTQLSISCLSKSRPAANTSSTGSPKKRRSQPPKSQSAIPAVDSEIAVSKMPIDCSQSSLTLSRTPSKARFTNIEEILDSEDDEVLSPTPPQGGRLEDSPSLPLVASTDLPGAQSRAKKLIEGPVPVSRIPSVNLTWAGMKPEVFSAITAHIRSLPPTTDPKTPSWHEKMLMYDPIVLEDFTSYLNGTTTIRTFKKATQKQIRAWNKVLKAGGDEILKIDEGMRDEMVLGVEKELEIWMVQGWCQEMSVCCISMEGKGRGTIRKQLY